MDKLYRINDVLSALASELGVRDSFENDDEYDAALNGATHAVAELFRVNE